MQCGILAEFEVFCPIASNCLTSVCKVAGNENVLRDLFLDFNSCFYFGCGDYIFHGLQLVGSLIIYTLAYADKTSFKMNTFFLGRRFLKSPVYPSIPSQCFIRKVLQVITVPFLTILKFFSPLELMGNDVPVSTSTAEGRRHPQPLKLLCFPVQTASECAQNSVLLFLLWRYNHGSLPFTLVISI